MHYKADKKQMCQPKPYHVRNRCRELLDIPHELVADQAKVRFHVISKVTNMQHHIRSRHLANEASRNVCATHLGRAAGSARAGGAERKRVPGDTKAAKVTMGPNEILSNVLQALSQDGCKRRLLRTSC